MQILLLTFCCTTAEIEVSFQTDGQTDGRRTDRRGSCNSYSDWQTQGFLNFFLREHAAKPLAKQIATGSVLNALQKCGWNFQSSY